MENPTPPACRTRFAIVTVAIAAISGVWILQSGPAPRGASASGPAPVSSVAPRAIDDLSAASTPAAQALPGTPLLSAPSQAASTAISAVDRVQLQTALDSARREVTAPTHSDAALPANDGVRYFAQNPAGRVHARFLADRVRFSIGADPAESAELRFRGASETTSIETTSHRVTYRHGEGVSEWFENGPAGIEHGFTFDFRPADAPAEKLQIDLELGNATATPGTSSDQLHFLNSSGEAILSYTSLKAWDATGTVLPATMTAIDGGIRLEVDDRNAAYPVMIDPLVTAFQQKILPEITGVGNPRDYFGDSIDLDGDTAIVAAPASNRAYIFVREAGAWALQASLPGGPVVAIDGDTAVVTGGDYGRVHIFVRDGSTWNLQASLRPANTTWWNFGSFGYSLAIEGDRLLIGVPGDQGNRGAACFFQRSGTAWTEGATILAPDGATGDLFGYSVALSGGTALIGAPGDSSASVAQCGSVRVFVENGNIWSEQAALRPQVSATGDNVGFSVALEGNTAVVGAPGTDSQAGAAFVFTRYTTVWALRAKLTISPPHIRLGWGLGLSGNTIVASGFHYWPMAPESAPAYVGSAAVFTGSGSSWALQQIVGSERGPEEKGFGVSAAVDGDTVLIGAYHDEAIITGRTNGRLHAFVRAASAWTRQAHIDAGETKNGTHFGSAIALQGDLAVIGMQAETTLRGFETGVAYVMTRSGGVWTRSAILAASDGRFRDHFGSEITLEGDTMLISAPFAQSAIPPIPPSLDYVRQGRVYVFTRTAGVWTEQAKIEHPDPEHYDHFGSSIGLSGDTLVVGAPFYSPGTGIPIGGEGGVFVFLRSGNAWIYQPAVLPGGVFGNGVVMHGDHLLVGGAGSVEVFHRSGGNWQRLPSLLPGHGFATYGRAFTVRGNTALVTAGYAPSQGAAVNEHVVEVFVFVNGAWIRQAVLRPNDPDLRAGFGHSLAVQGDTAIVGAPFANYGGAAYVFRRSASTWHQQAKLISPDAHDQRGLGERVVIDGDTVIASAPGLEHETNIDQTGAAYVFSLGESSQADLTLRDMKHNLIERDGSYDYGYGTVSSRRSDTFEMYNPGYSDLTGIFVTSSAPDEFTFKSLNKTTIAPGSTALLAIDFHPTASGLRTAIITISSPDLPDFTFTVRGTGNKPPVITKEILAGTYEQESLFDITQLITDEDDAVIVRELNSSTSLGGGSVTLQGNAVRYMPKPNFSGKDFFYFNARDNRGGTDGAYVAIDVVGPYWIGQMTSFSKVITPGSPVTIGFRSTPGRYWIFQRSTDLKNWTEVGRGSAPASGVITFSDPNPPEGKGYYRLKDAL